MAYRTSYEGLGIDPPDLIQDLTKPVSFDVYARLDEIGPNKEWPPRRFLERDQRLDYLAGLYRGTLGPHVKLGTNAVSPNLFKSYSTKLANILLMSEPTAEGVRVIADTIEEIEDHDQPRTVGDVNGLVSVCMDSLIDMTRFGGSLLLRLDESLLVPSPRNWYPTRADGDLLVRPYVSDFAPDSNADRVDVLHVVEGASERTTYAWGDGQIGDLVEAQPLEDAQLEAVARDPRDGIWGTAKYLDMWPMIAEIARRYSTNSRVLDLFTSPAPIFRQADMDARARFGVGTTDTEAQAQQKIVDGQLGILEAATIHLPDDLLDIDFLQPQTEGVAHALSQVEACMEVLRDVAGFPNLQGQTVSGEALKRVFIHFYAESSQIQTTLRLALERILNTEVEWPHIFDSGMFNQQPVEGRGGPNAVSDPVAEPPDEPEV